MSENPFQSPETEARVVGVRHGSREELRRVASYQKGILVCILIQILAVVAQLVAPTELVVLISVGSLLVGLASTVFVILLAMNVYSTVWGLLLGLLALIPCIGLVVLLFVNGKATRLLKQNGIRVGLMGARLSDL